jgi:hypothetical protein
MTSTVHQMIFPRNMGALWRRLFTGRYSLAIKHCIKKSSFTIENLSRSGVGFWVFHATKKTRQQNMCFAGKILEFVVLIDLFSRDFSCIQTVSRLNPNVWYLGLPENRALCTTHGLSPFLVKLQCLLGYMCISSSWDRPKFHIIGYKPHEINPNFQLNPNSG